MTNSERYCNGCRRMVDAEQRALCRRDPCIAKIEWKREQDHEQRERYRRELERTKAAQAAQQHDALD